MKYKKGDKFKGLMCFGHCEITEVMETSKFPYCIKLKDSDTKLIMNDKELEKDWNLIKETKQVGGDHYNKLVIDPYSYSFENELNCYQFNVIKYVTRYKDKNGIEDLKKAIHTINRLIEHEKVQD